MELNLMLAIGCTLMALFIGAGVLFIAYLLTRHSEAQQRSFEPAFYAACFHASSRQAQ